MNNIHKLIKTHPLISFFALTFLISWGLGAPVYLIPGWPGFMELFLAFGPAIAGFIILVLVEGKQGVRQVLSSFKGETHLFQESCLVLRDSISYP